MKEKKSPPRPFPFPHTLNIPTYNPDRKSLLDCFLFSPFSQKNNVRKKKKKVLEVREKKKNCMRGRGWGEMGGEVFERLGGKGFGFMLSYIS